LTKRDADALKEEIRFLRNKIISMQAFLLSCVVEAKRSRGECVCAECLSETANHIGIEPELIEDARLFFTSTEGEC